MSEEQVKPYKTLLGNRIYLKMELPTYSIQMADSAKKELIAEAAKKLEKAVVYDIGTGVHSDNPIEIGDEVMVGKEGIMRGDLVNLTKDLTVMMVNPLEIVQIW